MSTRLGLLFAFACAIVFTPRADAVNLSSNGLGQALIYPYYTVNDGQQTLVSLVNTTQNGKVVKVTFREAYNGRVVLEFNVYLSPQDVWTATVFALSDAQQPSDAAGIFTTDHSCTDPPFTFSGTTFGSNAQPYQKFLPFDYIDANADTGPASDARTREGHIEVILMSDIKAGSDLSLDTTHVNGMPPRCQSATLQAASGYVAPTQDGTPAGLADGGLFGAASIVRVADGTFYAYNADALDGFSYVSLYTLPGSAQPTLAAVNDRNSAATATARGFIDGEAFSATYPNASAGSRAIDAVSALFAAESIYNEYVATPDGAMGTDWVLTFPTKYLYVDAGQGGAIAGAASVFAPFDEFFGTRDAGGSCMSLPAAPITLFDREENEFDTTCPFDTCPPMVYPALCLETNVVALSFPQSSAGVLHSNLPGQSAQLFPPSNAGWIRWDMDLASHQFLPATNGNVFHGLPVTGFAATRYVNDYVPIPGGGLAIGTYSGAYRHRRNTSCTNASGSCK